jgi:HD-GYP domain-containing protein (c-di-GMP phosphodiesterase class II)
MSPLPLDSEVRLSPASVELFAEAEERVARRLSKRERLVETLAAAAFLAVAVPMALLLSSGPALDPVLAVALVGAYAALARVKFDVGAGYTVPTELLFVPMLLLLPPGIVPLCVAAAFLLADLPDYLRGRTHPERAVLAVGDAWYAVGPALVLAAWGADGPSASDWPVYLAALAAQFAFDFVTVAVREWLALGIPARVQIRERSWSYAVDAMLAPIGLMAAFASDEWSFAFLLCLPPAALLQVFARERVARMRYMVELSNTYRGTAMLLGDVVEADDAYTGSHSRSVVSLALLVSRQLGLDAREQRDLEFAALLHDVGKITIPNEIINKDGPLDDAEWELMRTHTVEGERMLERVGGVLGDVGRIVRSCHERWDGTGYPDGLAGADIPIEARIVCACDAFNAMVTTRAYRKGMTVEYALAELRACAGTQFDPHVAAVLAEIVEDQVEDGLIESQPERAAAVSAPRAEAGARVSRT